MSKAFTKDGDGSEAPLVVPARAPLPPGAPNYVTARGLATLRAELAALEAAGAHARQAEGEGQAEAQAERRREVRTAALGRAALERRIATAVLVDPRAQPKDEIRFGAHVTLRTAGGADRRHQIVGVDEADAAEGRVAFVAPVARALLGRRVGETVVVRTPRGEEALEVIAIDYESI
jgi:transcription elongation factor GreB